MHYDLYFTSPAHISYLIHTNATSLSTSSPLSSVTHTTCTLLALPTSPILSIPMPVPYLALHL
jgi:hypothetical protein